MGNLFVKIFKNLLTDTFIYGIIAIVRQYKINVFTYICVAVRGKEIEI